MEARFGGRELELKREFARLVAGGLPRFTAAMQLWKDDAQFAYWCHIRWENDAFIKAEIEKLEAEEEDRIKPPSKKELAMEVLDRVRQSTGDNYLKGMRLVAEMLGMIEKAAPNSGVNITQTQINPVMVVKDFGTEAEWQMAARKQQARLKAENAPATVIDHNPSQG